MTRFIYLYGERHYDEDRVLFIFMLNVVMLSVVAPYVGCRYDECRGHKAEINVLPDTVSRPCTVETTNLKNKVLKIMTLLSGNISSLASAS